MIIPSIDLQGGQTVQLIGGAEKALDAGDPRPIAARFGRVGEVAVIDLDAAMGKGDHAALIEEVCGLCDARVGGGIRSVEAAKRWLDAGAAKVILGTAATPELLSKLPKDRVIAALDARDGEVVVKGWTEGTGRGIVERMAELRPYVGGVLVTFVEREGRLGGTIAGGVTTAEDVAALDKLGADAQVGMALYTGRLSLAQGFAAPLISDRADGLWPTVVCDARGVALGLCWSDLESLTVALDRGVGAYHSRRRGLWVKGETSGATQALVRVEADCDRDALRFTVRQAPPGFCHEETWTCFGAARGLGALEATLQRRVVDAPAGSYTRRLLDDPALLRAKLIEEAAELAEAQDPAHVAQEAGDLLYFASVALARAGVSLADLDAVLDRRARTLSRRPGHAKPPPVEPT